jgi:hypothetical protein
MGKVIKKIFAAFVALIVFYVFSRFLIILGIVLVGYTISFLNIQPGEGIHPDTLESIGLIVNLFISGYVGIKVYKRMTRVKEDKTEE